MPKFIDQIIVGLSTFIISVFLPKHFITLVRELIKFIILSLIKYWYVTFLIVGIFLFINYYTDFRYSGQYDQYLLTLLTLFFLFLIPCISLLSILYKKFESSNIAFYGCYSVKENEFLTVDIDSESLSDRINENIEKISSSFYSYKNNMIVANTISLPKFIPILIGAKGLNNLIQKRIRNDKHIASIHFIRDLNKQGLSVVINSSRNTIIHSSPLDSLKLLIHNLSLDSKIHNSKIADLATRIYMLFFGQSMIDSLIHLKKISEVHYILDDMKNQLKILEGDLLDIPEKHSAFLKNFIDFWKGYVERYRGVLLAAEGEFPAAVQHILKSMELSPYYPYEDYQTLKQDYTKKYAINLTPVMNEMLDEIGKIESNADETDHEYIKKNRNVSSDLKEQVDFPFATFNHELLRGIILQNESERTIKTLLDGFEKLDRNNPFILLSIAEVIRFVKEGTEKYNAVYVSRFDETINLLKQVLDVDQEFPLIHTKIGSLLTMKGLYFDDENIVKEGMAEWQKGMHYMTQLGFSKK